ncbi:hypothetical protein JCM3774_004843 [Rhodotorula dairenensis]
MKSIAVSCVAVAALSLSLVAPVVGTSLHDTQLAAHRRRFHHVHRSPEPEAVETEADESAASVVDVDLAAPGELVVRNATPVEAAAAAGDAPHPTEAPTSSKHLMKRDYNGRATFFDPGLGACGGYSSAGDFMVAMNQAQYGDLGAVSSWCFQTITISYGGKTAQAKVMDACPGCPYGGLDMSPSLFNYFSNPDAGVIYVSWSAGGGGGGGGGDNGAAAAAASSSSQAAAAASSAAAAAAYSSSSAAAAWLSSSRAAAWASSSSASAAAAWASSSSSAAAAWASSSRASAAAAASAAASSSSAAAAAQAAQASQASISSADAASELASASSVSAAAAAAASLSSLATATANATLSAFASSTFDSLLATATDGSSASAAVSASAASASGSSVAGSTGQVAIPPAAVGGNLDAVPQLVIAIGNLVGAAAQAAK